MAKPVERALVLDASCVVALVCGWHQAHAATLHGVDGALHTHPRLVLPVHALVESFAVLTRLPPPHRMAPRDAATLLEGNFRENAHVVTLTAASVWGFLRTAASAGVAGGRTYDAWIAEAARTVRPALLLTWNVADFASFAGEGLEVRTPDGG